jgi:hypothetical protein
MERLTKERAMSIDITKIKVGDFVTVRAKVIDKNDVSPVDFCIALDALQDSACIWVLPSAILSHEPAPEPLKVGDVVTYDISIRRYTIIGLHGEQAWLEYSGAPWCFVNVSQLRRVEP